MKVLHFAFSSDSNNNHLPHNYAGDFVVYTGTHDNDTTIGWLQSLKKDERLKVQTYLGTKTPDNWHLIRKAEESVAQLAIIPMQDILSLPTDARMNRPGTTKGNWVWRMDPELLNVTQGEKLYEMTRLFGRCD